MADNTALSVDTQRLGQIAEALSAAGSWLAGARGEVGTAAAVARAGSQGADDGGLGAALQRLDDAWSFDLSGVANDLSTTGKTLAALATAYAQADAQGAASINP